MSSPRKMLACIPQDAATRARLAETTDFVTTPYSGSAPGICSDCGCAVWVGPRQQEIRRQYSQLVVVCLVCAATEDLRWGDSLRLTLGNPEHREDLPA